jgi:hypothetical protein
MAAVALAERRFLYAGSTLRERFTCPGSCSHVSAILSSVAGSQPLGDQSASIFFTLFKRESFLGCVFDRARSGPAVW